MRRTMIAFVGALVFLATIAVADDDPYAWRWYEVDANNHVHVNLYIFYRNACPHCQDALKFVAGIEGKHPWLNVRKYETSRHRGNLELYRRMAASVKRPAGTVPAFFYCNQATIGYTSDRGSGRPLEKRLIYFHDQLQKQLDERASQSSLEHARWQSATTAAFTASLSLLRGEPLYLMSLVSASAEDDPIESEDAAAAPSDEPQLLPPDEQPELKIPLELPEPPAEEEETVEIPFWGDMPVSDLSLPVFTLIIAGCDAFNPCAFFILLTLLSLLIHARSRSRMLLVGGIFVLFSGLFYFLFMAAWLNMFLLTGHLQWITVGAGLLAVVVALINIKDYFALKRGVSLSIPESAKPGLFARMRKLVAATSLGPMLIGTLALAFAANTYELLCTAGFPMVFTRALTLRELPAEGYYSYLLFYNLVYIVPLAVIVLVFTFTLGSHKLQEWEGRTLKLLSGVMMLLLGSVILFAPDLLHSVATAISLLVASIGLTALVAWASHLRATWHPVA